MSNVDPKALQKHRSFLEKTMQDDPFVTDWFHLTQDRVTVFGGVTNDFTSSHIDPVQGAKGPWPRVAAQGFLTLALLPYFAKQLPRLDLPIKLEVNYGMNKVRLIKPALVDDSFRARFKLKEVADKPGTGLITTKEVIVESKETGDPVMFVEWLGLLVF
ncbi:MAG: MaoC/PaaZ C-terminal domain-containing protein [Pseudomonadota bacterium]